MVRAKKLIFKIKKSRAHFRRCRRGRAAIAAGDVVANVVMEESMLLDEMSKR
jgi:hypothetical protein